MELRKISKQIQIKRKLKANKRYLEFTKEVKLNKNRNEEKVSSYFTNSQLQSK